MDRKTCKFATQTLSNGRAFCSLAGDGPHEQRLVSLPECERCQHYGSTAGPRYDYGFVTGSSRVVVSVGTGEVGHGLLAITGPSHASYARRVGADYVVISDTTAEWPLAEKFRVRDVASRYDHTLFVDADVFIRNTVDEWPIETVGRQCAMVRHDPYVGMWDWRTPMRAVADSQGVVAGPVAASAYWNSGVWVGNRESADYWTAPARPLPQTQEDEEHWGRIIAEQLGIEIVAMPVEWNWPWYYDHTYALFPSAKFLHFAAATNPTFDWRWTGRHRREELLKLTAASEIVRQQVAAQTARTQGVSHPPRNSRALLLDIDGVLNSRHGDRHTAFDADKLAILQELMDRADPGYMVVTSPWALTMRDESMMTPGGFRWMLRTHGLDVKAAITYLPRRADPATDRAHVVSQWAGDHPDLKWYAIDNRDMRRYLPPELFGWCPNGLTEEAAALALSHLNPRGGPGTVLKSIIAEFGIHPSPNCSCQKFAALMDWWGPDGCRSRRAEIVAAIKENAANWGWDNMLNVTGVAKAAASVVKALVTRTLSVTDPVGSLVDLAISKAE